VLCSIGEILPTFKLLKSAVHELDVTGGDHNILIVISLLYISYLVMFYKQSILDQLCMLLLVKIIAKYRFCRILQIVQMLLD
jgi:hypothetical protein